MSCLKLSRKLLNFTTNLYLYFFVSVVELVFDCIRCTVYIYFVFTSVNEYLKVKKLKLYFPRKSAVSSKANQIIIC